LFTTLCFSKLYYRSQVWLLPTIKESIYSQLFSQSGQCLSICNRDLSYLNLHKKYHKVTLRLFSLYQTAVNYYDTMIEQVYTQEPPKITVINTLSDCRKKILTFIRNKKCKAGLNLLLNRLHAISQRTAFVVK